MKAVIIDSNIVVKIILPEPDSDDAKWFYEHCNKNDIDILMPKFSIGEVLSVVRRKVHLGMISKKEASRCIRILEKLNINFINLDIDAYIKSYFLAESLNKMFIYDSAYLNFSQKNYLPLVTEDQKFLKQAEKLYKKIYSLKTVRNDSSIIF